MCAVFIRVHLRSWPVANRTTHKFENQLLDSLDGDLSSEILTGLRRIELRRGDLLVNAGESANYVFFPCTGSMISLVVSDNQGIVVEAGVTGSEGVVGISAVLGNAFSPHQAITQIPGHALKIQADIIGRELVRRPELQMKLLRYANFLLAQSSQTALCNRLHSLEERLARWLLMCQDRAFSPTLHLTHEILSQMLGSRRATVTLAAAVLQDAGFIRYTHGRVTILDRRGLQQTSCGCYDALSKELAGYLGTFLPG